MNRHESNILTFPLGSEGSGANLPQEDLFASLVPGKLVARAYKKKQIFLYEGHPALGVYWVQTGRVKVFKIAANGKPHILFFARPGDLLGFECVLVGNEFTASGEMAEDGCVAFVEKGAFLNLLRENPEFFLKITMDLARRIVFSEEERLHLAEASVRERMARTLLLLAGAHGKPAKEGIQIGLKLTREDLANIVGTAVGTVMRLLREFKEEKLLQWEGKDLIVTQTDRLKQVANIF